MEMSSELWPELLPEAPEEIELWEEGPPREPGAKPRTGPPAPGQVRLTLQIRRYDPERREEAWWEEHSVNMEPTDRLLDGVLLPPRFFAPLGVVAADLEREPDLSGCGGPGPRFRPRLPWRSLFPELDLLRRLRQQFWP